MSPIHPANAIIIILMNLLTFMNHREICACLLCNKIAPCYPSDHIRFHVTKSVEDFSMKKLRVTSHDAMSLILLANYKKQHSVNDLIEHFRYLNTLYNDMYVIARVFNFYGFDIPHVLLNAAYRPHFDNGNIFIIYKMISY